MPERVRKCPNCGGNLVAGRFDRETRCTFCGSQVLLDPSAVFASKFRDAFKEWDDPATHGYRSWVTVNDQRWAVGDLIARGETTDVFIATRARFPGENALLRVVRDPAHVSRLDRAWDACTKLQASSAPGAALASRLPEPIAKGVATEGSHKGRVVMLVRWAHGYRTTLEGVGRINAQQSVWVLRRILEALSFVHASGVVHGSVLPPHILIEGGEHGARLAGFGNAGAPGEKIGAVHARYRHITPDEVLSVRADLQAAGRTIVHAVGGDPTTGTVDAPAPYARALRALVQEGGVGGARDAWALREAFGATAHEAFGRPAFCPILPR